MRGAAATTAAAAAAAALAALATLATLIHFLILLLLRRLYMFEFPRALCLSRLGSVVGPPHTSER